MQLTDPAPTDGESFSGPNRRQFPRISSNSLSYVNLDETNGGILLNVSESGLAVQAAMSVMEDALPNVRLQIPRSKIWIEGAARVVWSSDSRKTVGIEFQHLPEEDRKQLREWLVIEGAVAAVREPASESELEATPANDLVQVENPSVALLPIEADEIDYSALLLTSEHASSIPLPAENTPRAVHVATSRPAEKIPPSVESLVAAKASDLRSRYAPVVITLAVLSLAAGWEAGRGNMLQSIFGIFESSSAAAALSADGSAQRVNPGSLSFLVVDAANQSWLVPFAGPTSAPPSAPIPALAPQSRSSEPIQAASTAPRTIRQWTLVAPQNRTRAGDVQNAFEAPQLSNSQQNGMSALSAAITSGVGAPAPPTSVYSNLVPVSVVHRIDPVYPQAAIQQRVDGTVKVHARISETGAVSEVTALNGSPLLQNAAVNAVKKWTFKPEILDGHAVASDFDVNIRFSLPQ